MLQAIRERAQGWVAYAIVGMISIPFALWGVNSYFNEGGSQNVITINDREIGQGEFRQAYSNQRQNLRQLIGENFRPEMLNEDQLREQVVQGLIDNELIVQNALSRGFRVGDQQIAQIIQREQSFQRDGKFDRALFDIYLRNQGDTADSFALRMKSALLRGQVEGGIRASGFISDAMLQRLWQLRNQVRSIDYAVIPTASYKDQPPNDDAIAAYYQNNRASYVTSHQVTVEYIELKLDTIASALEPEESLLKQRYEEQRSRFGVPEDRKVSHILVTVDDQRNEDQAKQRIQTLRQRIVDGEHFEDVAKAESDDPGSAEQGGDLGFIGRGIMDPEFERAAYALGLSDISEPIRTGFGYHLLKISAVKPGSIKAYADVRDELKKEAQREMAENQFFEQAEILANASYEHPDTLSVAADQLGVQIQESEWFSASGGDGIAENPRVVAAAFSEDVLNAGNNSEPLELNSDHLVVLRVTDQQLPAQQTLEEVRDSIVQTLADDQARILAKEKGQLLLKRLKTGETLTSIAADEELEVQRSISLKRDSAEVPGELRQLVFKLPKPMEANSSWGGTPLANGDYAVVVLNQVDVIDEEPSEEERQSLVQAILQTRGQDVIRSSIDSLRAKAEIKVFQENF